MQKAETIEGFYLHKFDHLPGNLYQEIGHFNVFRRDEFVGPNAKPVPYNRRNFFKISLIEGKNRVHYADKVLETAQQALFFANPLIPYGWECLEEAQGGYFCVFTETFFSQFGHIKEYPIFKPGASPLFELTAPQGEHVESLFLRMLGEISSEYVYKYDVLRTLTFELIHYALKLQPAEVCLYPASNASSRITSLFVELLERQFPVESPRQRIAFRTPAGYADQLAVHVNHLNKVLKETTGKTTSALIAERIAQEARALLKHTDWTIGEIAWCLGFDELPHFINFFKKHVRLTPRTYRINDVV
jgi:AraC-like DNA-binding protein